MSNTSQAKCRKRERMIYTAECFRKGMSTSAIVLHLKEKYGIDIHYGTSTQSFANSVQAVPITDSLRITEMLVNLTGALEKYPVDIVREI